MATQIPVQITNRRQSQRSAAHRARLVVTGMFGLTVATLLVAYIVSYGVLQQSKGQIVPFQSASVSGQVGDIIVPSSPGAPSTEVGGGIYTSTTWTLASSPYVVSSDVVVFPNVTLAIEPGVQVQFAPGTSLQNRGNLVAEGTASNHISFTSSAITPTAGIWGGVALQTNLGATARFGYVDFSYANAALSASCCGGGPDITVSNSTFTHNSTALTGYAGSQRMVVVYSTFDQNDIAVTYADKYLAYCTFTNNRYAMYIPERTTIEHSSFVGNGVAVSGGNGTTVRYSTIIGNDLAVQGGTFGGAFLQYNTIANNDRGVTLPLASLSYNNLYSNTFFNISNTTATNMSAPNNYFGTTNTSAIDATIYDGYDNIALGIVDYRPFSVQPIDISGPTPTSTPVTYTATVTPTSVTTATATSTVVFTPTFTPVFSSTTPTNTPTNTSTNTPTRTSTATTIPTDIPTETPTRTTPMRTSTPTITQTPINGLPQGFLPHWACRNNGDGAVRDTELLSNNTPAPACPRGWSLMEILVRERSRP